MLRAASAVSHRTLVLLGASFVRAASSMAPARFVVAVDGIAAFSELTSKAFLLSSP